jgi:hypothetical protein
MVLALRHKKLTAHPATDTRIAMGDGDIEISGVIGCQHMLLLILSRIHWDTNNPVESRDLGYALGVSF